MQVINKNAEGYGYKYTDLAEITKVLLENGYEYYQYIEPVDGVDYIITVIEKDGKLVKTARGCRVVEAKLSGKSNPVQEYGSALTYCRRYSLLMAFGLATTDDDATACNTNTEYISQKEQEALRRTVEEKGYKVDKLFPKGLNLTTSQYVDAINRLKQLKSVKG